MYLRNPQSPLSIQTSSHTGQDTRWIDGCSALEARIVQDDRATATYAGGRNQMSTRW